MDTTREDECAASRAEVNAGCQACGFCFAEILDERNKLRNQLALAGVKMAACTKVLTRALATVDKALDDS